ncbi:hypothetical protein [Nocardioides taihuensis]|uniref:DUF732 domain-containing protein n=1 Tax=Nocardioides taihuensis TaxID=1835606 RepID=A0ABW0BPU3_9ACTN
MIGHDTERRLAAVLHEHAEAAMSQTDTYAQHELLMIGRQDDPGGGPHRLVATAVAAAAVAAAGTVVLWSAGSGDDQSSPDPAGTGQVQAVAVADAFVHALAAKNPHGASLYVAPGHEPWAGWTASVRRDIAWEVKYDLEPCAVANGDGPGTRVDCPYSMHLLGSAEADAGPFAGICKVQVVDGKVVWVENTDAAAVDGSELSRYLIDVRTWIAEHHPDDLAFLLAHEQDLAHDDWTRWTDLWRKYAAEYVAAQR